MKIFKNNKKKCDYLFFVIIFGAFILGISGGYLISANRQKQIEKLLLQMIQSDSGYLAKSEQYIEIEDLTATSANADNNNNNSNLNINQECGDYADVSIIDGFFLQIAENRLMLAGQKEDEGKVFEIILTPETEFIKWVEERGTKEEPFSQKELLAIKNNENIIALSVVALCPENSSNDCEAKIVRVIPED